MLQFSGLIHSPLAEKSLQIPSFLGSQIYPLHSIHSDLPIALLPFSPKLLGSPFNQSTVFLWCRCFVFLNSQCLWNSAPLLNVSSTTTPVHSSQPLGRASAILQPTRLLLKKHRTSRQRLRRNAARLDFNSCCRPIDISHNRHHASASIQTLHNLRHRDSLLALSCGAELLGPTRIRAVARCTQAACGSCTRQAQ